VGKVLFSLLAEMRQLESDASHLENLGTYANPACELDSFYRTLVADYSTPEQLCVVYRITDRRQSKISLLPVGSLRDLFDAWKAARTLETLFLGSCAQLLGVYVQKACGGRLVAPDTYRYRLDLGWVAYQFEKARA
jgi:hypothetical protein